MSSAMSPHETVMPSGTISDLWARWESSSMKVTYRAQSRLYRALFCDIARHFPNFVLQDFSYLLLRIEKEGGSFYLEKLPELGKAFETSLITNERFIAPNGWELLNGTRLPKFLNQLFKQLMNDDGSPLWSYQFGRIGILRNSDQSIVSEKQRTHIIRAVQYIRQCCMMWSKVEMFTDVSDSMFSPKGAKLCAKSQKALDGFVTRVSTEFKVDNLEISDRLNEARRLLRCVFTTASPELEELKDFVKNPWGRQGPGAVAGREVGCEKWSFEKWPGLPRQLFTWRDGMDCEVRPVLRQPDARVCLVPKDFRGPRVICIEPKENQFAQQGLMDILYRLVSRCALTNRSISFLDTEVSRAACFDYRYATIDLKDASDTIHLVLARLLLPRWIFKLVTRYRSRGVETPDNQVVKTTCLATMGNATCFPLETLLFWALSLGTMIILRDSFPIRMHKHLNFDVRVFGDDIIVPLWACDEVARTLESVGLLLNTSKTCQFSLVRESCGEWVFAGEAIKIVRFRSLDVSDHRSFVQWRDLRIDLLHCDKENLSAMGEEMLELLQEYVLDRSKNYPKFFKTRWNKNLQRLEVYAPVFVQQGRLRELVDAAGLYAWHVHNDRTPCLKGARKRVIMRWQDTRSFRL